MMKTMITFKAVVKAQYASELQVWVIVACEPVWHWIMFPNDSIPLPAASQSLDGWMEGFTERFIGQLAFSEWWLIIAWWPCSDKSCKREEKKEQRR